MFLQSKKKTDKDFDENEIESLNTIKNIIKLSNCYVFCLFVLKLSGENGQLLCSLCDIKHLFV